MIFFVSVGCLAAIVHWGTVVALVAGFAWHPLVANVAGWLLAFTVSFSGHHLGSFRGHGAPLLAAARRFFVVSALGFVVNEIAYAMLLRWSGQSFELVLALLLVAVAGLTYLASRHWAFLSSAGR